jgi:parallel beta-helix repeat protein
VLEIDLACDLSITGVGPIWLDCRSHSIGHINLWDLSGATVANCNAVAIELFNVHQGLVIRNRTRGVGLQISAGIDAKGGGGNQIVDNVIDGAWNGDPRSQAGADDGILIYNEVGDTVQGNTISHVWDAGIEGVGSVSNTTIAFNTIDQALIAGIGAYRNTSWRSNTIEWNSVSHSQLMFRFDNAAVGGQTSGFAFRDNRILNNRFVDSLGTPTSAPAQCFFFPEVDVANNVIQGNDFRAGNGRPVFEPGAGFVDGGGNFCAAATPLLHCN